MANGNRSTPDRSHADLLVAAAFFALATGAVEAAIAGFKILVSHRLTFMGPDIAWMSPVSYLAFFLAFSLPAWALAAALRRPVPLRWAVACYAALAAFSLLLPYEHIARWASALLGVGVGVQCARLMGDAARWRRRLRVGTVLLAGWVLATGVGVRAWRALGERRALAGLPAWATGAPSVLFIVLDTVRRANLHLYGYGRPTTPRLDARAAEGAVFDRAIASAPWTLPSHASFFTGRPAASLDADWRTPLGRGPRTMAEAFAARGYATGGFVANLLYTSFETGLDRGFARYDDYHFSWHLVLYHSALGRIGMVQILLRSHSLREMARAVGTFDLRPGLVPANIERQADNVTDAFLAWRRTVGSRPYFAFLNYFDAHGPYRAPDRFMTAFRREPRQPTDRYDASIAWLDSEVGRLLDSLAAFGQLDSTLVVVVSDHGELFGEHGLKGHANGLYLPLLEVPLYVRYPRAVPAATRVAEPVSLVDLAATVLDLAGVRDSAVPGTSLARWWRAPQPPPALIMAEVSKGINVDSTFPNSRGPMRTILDGRLHYIRTGTGGEELYAWRSDSLELHNLAADTAWAGDLVRLRARLDSARAGWAGVRR